MNKISGDKPIFQPNHPFPRGEHQGPSKMEKYACPEISNPDKRISANLLAAYYQAPELENGTSTVQPSPHPIRPPSSIIWPEAEVSLPIKAQGLLSGHGRRDAKRPPEYLARPGLTRPQAPV